jgi:hypothetical protein
MTMMKKSKLSTSSEFVDLDVEEHVEPGTEKILESSLVSEGPGRIANSPVPSIFRDDRGEIHRMRVGGKRVNILCSKRDVMRSGYLVLSKTVHFVVSGKVEVWNLTEKGTEKMVYGADSVFYVNPYVPHILHFLEDTILLEFWDGPFQCWYYHPYRRLVQLQNELVTKDSTGHIGVFQRLVPADLGAAETNSYSGLLVGLVGLVAGIGIGAVVATRHK